MPPVARTLQLLAGAAVAAAVGAGAAPAAAQTKACQLDITPTYTDACGPTFVLPGWGDAAGWTQPEQYETIQLADVDGDGADELLARQPGGLAIHVFDKTLGQWRPQVDANNVAVILTAFANPPPLTTANPNPPSTDWTLPQYYDTIQAADIDGQKGEEILARSAAGVIVFKFTPTPGGNAGQGSWQQLTTSGPLPDPDWAVSPSYYATIQTGDVSGDKRAELVARGSGGIVAFSWTGSGWRAITSFVSNMFPDREGFTDPKYWTTIQLADIDGDGREEVLGRDESGMVAYEVPTGNRIDGEVNGPFAGPIPNVSPLPDCPFEPGANSCFGSGPAYYSTIQLADVDGNGREELLGRASDGVRVRRYQGDTPDPWGALPTLPDLSDQNGYTNQSRWETIQLADINGDRRAEALARGAQGLLAWTYDRPSRTWKALPANPALSLADDFWASDRSYYSTIQTGDVDGDRRADVVARGPYGIRTWFYNRRSTGGWEPYIAQGYPDFPCHAANAPTSCEQAAFIELTKQAKAQHVIVDEAPSVRAVYAGLDAPAAATLDKLSSDLVSTVGKCSSPTSDKPPQYGSCTPPTGTGSSFTPADWTKVLNTILAEVYWAGFVVGHFSDMVDLKKTLYLEQNGQLPAIDADLKLAAAANTPAEFDAKEIFSGMYAIAAAVADEPPLGPILDIVAELIAMLPSASPTLSGPPFQGKYDDFVKRFGASMAEIDTALAVHSQTVRQDPALLVLVGQLRALGTWSTPSGTLGLTGMESVGRQGWMLSVWKTLLPTLWARYFISSCATTNQIACAPPPAGPWMIGTSTNFSAIGPTPTPQDSSGYGGSPCDHQLIVRRGRPWVCQFVAPGSDLANIIWGPLTRNCAFDGSNATTAWKFPPTCTLGVDPRATLADSSNPMKSSASQGWELSTYTGSPVVSTGTVSAGSARPVGGGEGAVLRLSGRVGLPRPVRLGRARVVSERLLFERGVGGGELVRHRSGRALPRLVLPTVSSRKGGERVFASQRRLKPLVRVRLRRSGPRRRLLSFTLAARNVTLPALPSACSGTRRGVDLPTGPIPLHTRLRVDDGRRKPIVISLQPQWRCIRNRLGAVRRLAVRPPAFHVPRGRSPAIRIRGPRRIIAGKGAAYRIRVQNRRRTTAYDVLIRAALPRGLSPRRVRGARVSGRQVTWRLRALGPGRSRTVLLRQRVAHSATGPACQTILVTAIDTRAAHERLCIRVASRGIRR